MSAAARVRELRRHAFNMTRHRTVCRMVLVIALLSLTPACERSTQALLQRLTVADSGAVLGFPRVRTGLRTTPLRQADVRASDCNPLPADTAQWRANVLPTELVDVAWITVRTPFKLPPSFPGAPRRQRARVDSTGLHRLLGSWSIEKPGSALPGEEEQSLAIWVGPAAYPTELLPLGTSQVALSECVSAAGEDAVYVAEYAVVWRTQDTTYHVSAYLPLTGDIAITALGRSLTPELRAELAAVIRTTRLFR